MGTATVAIAPSDEVLTASVSPQRPGLDTGVRRCLGAARRIRRASWTCASCWPVPTRKFTASTWRIAPATPAATRPCSTTARGASSPSAFGICRRRLRTPTPHDDSGRAGNAREELDQLVEYLSGALGLGGRARPLGSAAERARSTVTWRIRNAIRKIAAAHPRLGRHLENTVRTGTFCGYEPETPTIWAL